MEGSKLISGYSPNFFASIFDEHHFIGIDRSHLVKKTFISRVKRKAKGNSICLRKGQETPLGRRKRQEVKKRAFIFLKNLDSSSKCNSLVVEKA